MYVNTEENEWRGEKLLLHTAENDEADSGKDAFRACFVALRTSQFCPAEQDNGLAARESSSTFEFERDLFENHMWFSKFLRKRVAG